MSDFSWNCALTDATAAVWVGDYATVSKIKDVLARGSDKMRPFEVAMSSLMTVRFKSTEFLDKTEIYYKWNFECPNYLIAEGLNTQGDIVGVQDASGFCSNGTRAVLSLRKSNSASGKSTDKQWGDMISVRKSEYNKAEGALGVFAERQFHYGSIIGFIAGECYSHDASPKMDVQVTDGVTGEDTCFRCEDGRCVRVKNKFRTKWNDLVPLYLGMHYIQKCKKGKKDKGPNVEVLTDGTVRVIKRISNGQELIVQDNIVCPFDVSNWSDSSTMPSKLSAKKLECATLVSNASTQQQQSSVHNNSPGSPVPVQNPTPYSNPQGSPIGFNVNNILQGNSGQSGLGVLSAAAVASTTGASGGVGSLSQLDGFGNLLSNGGCVVQSVSECTQNLPHSVRQVFLSILDSVSRNQAERLALARVLYNEYLKNGPGALYDLFYGRPSSFH